MAQLMCWQKASRNLGFQLFQLQHAVKTYN